MKRETRVDAKLARVHIGLRRFRFEAAVLAVFLVVVASDAAATRELLAEIERQASFGEAVALVEKLIEHSPRLSDWGHPVVGPFCGQEAQAQVAYDVYWLGLNGYVRI